MTDTPHDWQPSIFGLAGADSQYCRRCGAETSGKVRHLAPDVDKGCPYRDSEDQE